MSARQNTTSESSEQLTELQLMRIRGQISQSLFERTSSVIQEGQSTDSIEDANKLHQIEKVIHEGYQTVDALVSTGKPVLNLEALILLAQKLGKWTLDSGKLNLEMSSVFKKMVEFEPLRNASQRELPTILTPLNSSWWAIQNSNL
jgi:hypothetical protein